MVGWKARSPSTTAQAWQFFDELGGLGAEQMRTLLRNWMWGALPGREALIMVRVSPLRARSRPPAMPALSSRGYRLSSPPQLVLESAHLPRGAFSFHRT